MRTRITPILFTQHNWSVNYVELDEFDYVGLIYYKVGLSLLQSGIGIAKLVKHYHEVGQLRVTEKQDKSYYKVGRWFIIKWGDFYCKVGQILQSVVIITK